MVEPQGENDPRVSSRGSVWSIVAIVAIVVIFVAVLWWLGIDPTGTMGTDPGSSDLDLDAFEDLLGGGAAQP